MVPRSFATTTTTTTTTTSAASTVIRVPKCKCKENQILLERVNEKLIQVKDRVRAVKEAAAAKKNPTGGRNGSPSTSPLARSSSSYSIKVTNKSTYELILKRAMTSIVQHTIPISCYKDALTLKHIGPNIALLMFPPSLSLASSSNNNNDESDNDSDQGQEKENNNTKKRKARVSKKTSKSSISNDNINTTMSTSTTGSLLQATTTAAPEETNNNHDSPLRTKEKQASKKKQKVTTTATTAASSTTSSTNNTMPTTTITTITNQTHNQHTNNRQQVQAPVQALQVSKKHTQYHTELYKSQQQQELYFNKGYIWRVVLLIDCREHQSSHVISKCRMSGIPCEERTLPIGDMVWIAQGYTSSSLSSTNNKNVKLVIELILGTIIERKSIEDLRSSIYGTRYFEQRIRLRDSGIQQLIYLIEGNKNKDLYMCPSSTLHTAEWETRLYYNFSVIRTNHIDETIVQLKRIHRRIVQRTFPTSFYNEALPTFHECTIISNSSNSNNNNNNDNNNNPANRQKQQQRRRYRRRRVQSLFELSFDIDPVVPQFTYNTNNCTSSSSYSDETTTQQQQQHLQPPRFITYNELKTKIEYDRECCTRTIGSIHQAMLKQVSTLSTIKCHSISKLFTTPNQIYQFYSNYNNNINNNILSTSTNSRQIVTNNSLLNTQQNQQFQQHQNNQLYKYLLANIPLRENNNNNNTTRNHTVDNRSLIGQRSSTELYIAYGIQSIDTTTITSTTNNGNNRISNPYDCRNQSPSYEELIAIRNSYCNSPNKVSISISTTTAAALSKITTDCSINDNNENLFQRHKAFDLQSTKLLSNSTSQSTVMIIDDNSNKKTNNSNKTVSSILSNSTTNQITLTKPGKVNKPASSSASPLVESNIYKEPTETAISLVRMTSTTTGSSLDNEANVKVLTNTGLLRGKVDSPSTQQTNISDSYDFFDGTPLVDKKKGGKITASNDNKNCESHVSNVAIDLSLDDDTDDDNVENDNCKSQLLFSTESSKASSNISRQSMRNQYNDSVIANENKLNSQLSSSLTPSNNKTYKHQSRESLSTRRSSYDTYKSTLSSDFYLSDDDVPLFESMINTTRTGSTTGSCKQKEVIKINNDSIRETTGAITQNMKSFSTISCLDNSWCGTTTQMEQNTSIEYTKRAECEIVAATTTTTTTCRNDTKTAPSSLLKSLQISLLSDDDDD